MAAALDRRLLAESRLARTHMLVAVGLGALSAGLIVAQAALLAYVIERAAMHHATLASLRIALIALAVVLGARALTAAAFELAGRWGAVGVMSELRGRLVARLVLHSPEERPAGSRTGELAGTAVQGVDALESYFAGYLPQLVLAVLVPLAVIGWVLRIDPLSAAVLALTVPVLLLFMVLIGKGAREQADGRWRALSLLGAHFLDVVQGLQTLRAYGREQVQERTLARVGERYRCETMATLRVAFLSALVLELCAMIGTALVAATVGVQLVAGALGLQAGLTVLLLAPELYGPLRMVGQQFHSSTDAGAASERIFAALSAPAGGPATCFPAGEARACARSIPDPSRAPLRMHGLHYRYPGCATDALAGVDLELAPGRMTALVGPSGSGKSTLARLLMRLLEASEGAITCAGLDLRELGLDAWRSQIAWVPQRPTLFSGTVAQNIALYAPGATRAQIERAACAASAREFITALPDGLQTQLGEGARRLSAGQAQRIALARAFLAERPLLVLDEPTAHLDRERALSVASALQELARGRTTLLIAHDEQLARLADECHVLRAGRVHGPAAGALAAGAMPAAPTGAILGAAVGAPA